MDVLCGLVFFILRKFYKAHRYVPEIGMWNGAKTKSMFLFLYPFWGQKLGHDGNGERSNLRRMSVWRRKTHTKGKAIT